MKTKTAKPWRNVITTPYIYFFNQSIPKASRARVKLRLDADADFVWRATLGRWTNRGLTVRVRDNATRRWLMGNPVHINNWAGSTASPFYLVEPYTVKRGSSLTFILQNLTRKHNKVQIALWGYKQRNITQRETQVAGSPPAPRRRVKANPARKRLAE